MGTNLDDVEGDGKADSFVVFGILRLFAKEKDVSMESILAKDGVTNSVR
jgi:hypothetical protein